MRSDKGVMDLPVKLIIVMVVISMTIPMVSAAVDVNKDATINASMDSEFGRFRSAVSDVYYSGVGASAAFSFDVPAGYEVCIGGDEADTYSIRLCKDDAVVMVRYMERPAVPLMCNAALPPGCNEVMLTSMIIGGVLSVVVSV